MTQSSPLQRYPAYKALVLGFGGLAVLVGGLFGGSGFTSISGAVIASGRVQVETRNQVVEHIDGGTVSEIMVRDGDTVARDQVLLRFSDPILRSEEAILRAQFAELVARRNRLEAEFRGTDAIVWNTELAALAQGDAVIRDILESQERLFRAREAARSGQVARLRERIGQVREEIKGLMERSVSLEQQSELIELELDAHRKLFEKGMTQLDRLLALERAARDLEGQAGTTAASMARARGRIAELEIQILQIDARRIEEAEEQTRDVKARENQVREHLSSVRERLERTVLRAPVAGVVFEMSVFAPQEVVRPGEPILHIVPEGGRLVVLARLDPIHVDQVYPGQSAVLRFTAFPVQVTPEAEGRVVRVSADVVRDVENGLSWYEVELAVEKSPTPVAPAHGADTGAADSVATNVRGLGNDLVLTPGMPVEVHLRTGERTLLSYLAKPVTDFFSRSLRRNERCTQDARMDRH